MSRLSSTRILLLLAVLTPATLVVAPWIGQQPISFSAILEGPGGTDIASVIFWQLRLPRVLLAMLSGAVLATGGMIFQAMFRNALATPFTLGIASGASLGASLCIITGTSLMILGVPVITWSSLIGAMLTMMLVYGLSRNVARRHAPGADNTLLLAGVAISFFFSSLILFVQYMADFSQSARIIRWIMGGLESGVGYSHLLSTVPTSLAGILFIITSWRKMNLMASGDEIAMARGLDILRFKRTTFLFASMMIGAVVATCGPIGFVGLIVPHIARLLVGNDHRHLIPATVMIGAIFLSWCDTLGRMIIAPAELPVGIITALLGGPFFLWLLLSGRPGGR